MKVILLLLISMAAIVSGGLWGGAASSSSHSKSKSKVSAPLPVNNAPLIFVGQRPEKRPDSHHKMLEAFEENVLRNHHQQQKSLKKQQARNNEHIENKNNNKNIESSASSFSSDFDESTNSYYSYSNNRHDESYSLMASMEEKDIFNHQPFSIEDEERRIFGEESADDEEQQFNQEFDGYDGEEQEEEETEAVHQLGRKQKQKPKSKIHHPTPSCKWPDLYRLEVALLLVREGGEIIVCSGNYTGSFVVTKQMTIKGQKTTPKLGMPIIASTINVRADNVIIERLKFFPGFPLRTMAIRTISTSTQTADRLEVRDNIFRNTAGVLLQGTRWSKVHDNLFDNFQPSNVLNSLGFGVSIQSTIANADRGTLFNEVFNNRFQLQNLTLLESCVGVLIGDGDGGANMFSRVRNNLFRRAGLAGVFVYNLRGDGLTSQATVEHNLFFDGAGSGDGVYIPSSNSHLIQHNKFYQVDNGISLGDLVRPYQPTYAESNTYVNNNRFKNGTGSDLFIDNTGFANIFDDNDAESFCDWSFGQTSQIVLPNNRFLARFCARKRSLSEKHPQVEELLQAAFPNPQE